MWIQSPYRQINQPTSLFGKRAECWWVGPSQQPQWERLGHQLKGGETGENVMPMHMTPSVGLSLLIDLSPASVNAVLLWRLEWDGLRRSHVEIKSKPCFRHILGLDHLAELSGRNICQKYSSSQDKKRGDHKPSGSTVFPGDQRTQILRLDLFLSSCYIQVCAEEGWN